MPVNGWWHEWTFNYDVQVENNEVHLDLAEHEAKILVWLGENWQPMPPEVKSDTDINPNTDNNTNTEAHTEN